MYFFFVILHSLPSTQAITGYLTGFIRHVSGALFECKIFHTHQRVEPGILIILCRRNGVSNREIWFTSCLEIDYRSNQKTLHHES